MKSSRVHAACCDPKQTHPRHKKPQTYPLQWAACCPGAEPQTLPPAPASGILSLPSATAEEHPEQPGTWQGCRRLGWVRSGSVGAFSSRCLGRWVFWHLCRRGRWPGPEELTVQINSGNACKQRKSLNFPCRSAHSLYNLNNSIFPITPCRKLCLPEICVWNYSHCIKQLPPVPSLLVSQMRGISFFPEWCGHHLRHYRLVSSNF